MRMFRKAAVAAMSRLSGSLTNPSGVSSGGPGNGYFFGGSVSLAISRLAFVTNTLVNLDSMLATLRYYCAAMMSDIKGYVRGGNTYSSNRLSSSS